MTPFRRTVLVTGAAGFIGSHLVDRLLGDGFEVVGLDNLMTGDLANLTAARRDPRFHLAVGDVRDPPRVHAELVFNLACPASPVHYRNDPHATLTSSVLGALRLVEHARGRRCRIVHASTSEVYGDPLVHPQPESYTGNVDAIGERACYKEGKRAAETIFTDAARTAGIDVRIARVFNTYGPRLAFGDGRVVSNFVLAALRDQPIVLDSDGEQTRSFCYVGDLVDGLVRLAAVEPARPLGPVNLGAPTEVSMRGLAEAVMAAAGRRVELVSRPAAPDDARRRCPDIALARSVLGFEPRVALDRGLALTCADFRARIAAAET
jgi:UDP-glucuronate decarboxylase